MYFYDPKTKKHYCEIDEDRISIVGWAEKGIVLHLRVIRMGQLRNFWDSLTANYSKLVYDPIKEEAWIQHQGWSGNSCRDILKFMMTFDLKSSEEYVVVYKRYARNPTSFSLPKEAAEYEYDNIKGIGISKAIAAVSQKNILKAEGNEANDCSRYLTQLIS